MPDECQKSSFKIWMFRGQYRLTEERGLQRTCLFVVRVNAKAWIEASFSAQASRLDLELIKTLRTYDKIGSEIGDVALSKLSSHLWYVSEELVERPSSTPTCPARPKTP